MVAATLLGVAPADAPSPAPLVGRGGRGPAAEAALLPTRAVAHVATLTVLVGIPPLAEVVCAAKAAPPRRPRRLLGAPVAAQLRRRPAVFRRVGP